MSPIYECRFLFHVCDGKLYVGNTSVAMKIEGDGSVPTTEQIQAAFALASYDLATLPARLAWVRS